MSGGGPFFTIQNGLSVSISSNDSPLAQNSANRYYLNSAAPSSSYIITFSDSRSIRLSDFSQWLANSSNQQNVIGIPSSSEVGFANSIGVIGGESFSGTFDIYDNNSGALLLDDYRPQGAAPPGVLTDSYINPCVQLGYSSGSLTLKAPRGLGLRNQRAIVSSDGSTVFRRPPSSYVGGESGTAVNQYISGSNATPWKFSLNMPPMPGIVCFCRGTLIYDDKMRCVPIEEVRIGMVIATSKGNLPVKWVAKRSIKRSLSTEKVYQEALPIKIGANSIDDEIPFLDLYVSGRHGILADGKIVNAFYLENGCNITRATQGEFPDLIEYYHLEFDFEVLVFANGLKACSYVNAGNRRCFDNYGEFISLYVDVDSTARSRITALPRNQPLLQGHKRRVKRSWLAA